jgi:hypothetical protein
MDVASIHDVEGARFEHDLIEHRHVVDAGGRDVNEAGDALGGRSKPANDGRLKTGQRN